MNLHIREWLRVERLLGMPHYATSIEAPPPVESARAPAASAKALRTLPAAPADPPPPTTHEDLPPACTEELSVDAARAALDDLNQQCVVGCTKCRLHEHRTQTVFGDGHPRADLVFVGEGPGADEDAQGIPFVGRAGQLLTRMIAAMTLTREQVYICNVVKCRPPGNRTPTEDEMQVCSPYLLRQLAILRPKVIVTLGRPAAQTLLTTKTPISRLRGQFQDFPPPTLAVTGLPTIRLMPTYHPAYLLRNPSAKADVWEDLQQVMRLLELQIPQRG